jgi:hypothetical protein
MSIIVPITPDPTTSTFFDAAVAMVLVLVLVKRECQVLLLCYGLDRMKTTKSKYKCFTLERCE